MLAETDLCNEQTEFTCITTTVKLVNFWDRMVKHGIIGQYQIFSTNSYHCIFV